MARYHKKLSELPLREYIFTEYEREIAQVYLKKDLKLNGFKVLVSRIRKNSTRIKEDMELLDSILEKLQTEERASTSSERR